MQRYDLDVVLTRGPTVESTHRVHAAVVAANDSLIGGARDTHLLTFWRSGAKPFQILPLLESGGFERLGWGAEELALACGSHGGEPEHVAIVEKMLQSLDLEEGDLACGPQEPLSARGARIARESGIRTKRTHNNCSGKHTAMLALAHRRGWPIKGYELAEHPVQQAILSYIALWTGIAASECVLGVDGCGAVVFGLPLDAIARSYARFGAAECRGVEAPTRVIDAMTGNPFLVGGTDRFDSVLMEETDGAVVSKIGAEGVQCALIRQKGIGIAIKVEDGSSRAQYPAVLKLLQELGALPLELPPRLAEWMRKPVRNTRGDVVGELTLRSSLFPPLQLAAV